MTKRPETNFSLAWLVLLAVAWLLAGCNVFGEATERVETPGLPPAETDTQPTAMPTITPTPLPVGIVVNNEGVPLVELEASLKQLVDAETEQGIERSAEDRLELVVEDLVSQTLLAQEARRSGFSVDDTDLDVRLEQLAKDAGGEEALLAWMTQMGYADETAFRFALRRSLEAAWQRDQIAASIPERVEQVRARQILVRFPNTAESVHRQLQAGADFATLAFQYDSLTGGELGWFPRGFLTQPVVEQAAFNLQPGQFSEIIESPFGFHIVQVVERAEDHELSQEARLHLQQNALAEWISRQREVAQVEVRYP
ncbi:MAG: peptidylprolyl isomerase [Chloroflexota bacterium]|jgi:peptidyl-prolyl cis-trans isomerase C